MERHYQNEPKFNDAYSKNNLTKIKNEAHKIYLDAYKSTRTYWIQLYVNSDNVIYFHSFGVEHILK